MKRFTFSVFLPIFCASLAGVSALAAASTPAATIYKHVDEQGRVTYTNAPIKGGVKVELEPLTVIPATPTGSLSTQSAAAPFHRPAPVLVPVAPAPSTVAAISNIIYPTPQVSAPLPAALPPPAEKIIVAVKAEPPQAAIPAAPTVDNIAKLTEQRRIDTKRRLLETELGAEETALASARAKLDEEQKNSSNVRLMRASFSPNAEGATPQKPLISKETRTEIERHFERIRNLQDQIAMHDKRIQDLQSQLAQLK